MSSYSRLGKEGLPSNARSPQHVEGFSNICGQVLCQIWEAPAQKYGTVGHCATALYSATSKQNKLEQVGKKLLRVAQTQNGCFNYGSLT